MSQLAPLVRSLNLDFHLTSERCFLPTTKQSPVFCYGGYWKYWTWRKKVRSKKQQPLGEKNKILMLPHLNLTLEEEKSTKQCMSTLKERKYYSFHDIVVSDITWSLLFNHVQPLKNLEQGVFTVKSGLPTAATIPCPSLHSAKRSGCLCRTYLSRWNIKSSCFVCLFSVSKVINPCSSPPSSSMGHMCCIHPHLALCSLPVAESLVCDFVSVKCCINIWVSDLF